MSCNNENPSIVLSVELLMDACDGCPENPGRNIPCKYYGVFLDD